MWTFSLVRCFERIAVQIIDFILILLIWHIYKKNASLLFWTEVKVKVKMAATPLPQ